MIFVDITVFAAYDIRGKKLVELPPQFKYNPYAALTTYTLSLGYEAETVEKGLDPVSCKYTTTGKFTSGTCSTTTSVDLPNWVDGTNATQNAQAEWNRFIAAAGVHENGHVKIVDNFKRDKTGAWTTKLFGITVTGSADTQATATDNAKAKLKSEASKIKDNALQELDGVQVKA